MPLVPPLPVSYSETPLCLSPYVRAHIVDPSFPIYDVRARIVEPLFPGFLVISGRDGTV